MLKATDERDIIYIEEVVKSRSASAAYDGVYVPWS